MFSITKLTTLAICSLLTIATAAPGAVSDSSLAARQISALTVCSTTACKVVPSAIDVCTDTLDSFGFLFKAIVNATTPTGLVCVFFANFECLTFPGDSVSLDGGGTFDFDNVVTADGVIGFANQTSSIECF